MEFYRITIGIVLKDLTQDTHEAVVESDLNMLLRTNRLVKSYTVIPLGSLVTIYTLQYFSSPFIVHVMCETTCTCVLCSYVQIIAISIFYDELFFL